jgi:hypothetical protein
VHSRLPRCAINRAMDQASSHMPQRPINLPTRRRRLRLHAKPAWQRQVQLQRELSRRSACGLQQGQTMLQLRDRVQLQRN